MSNASCSQAFDEFHPDVQRWIWKQGWSSIRDVQERAAAPIMSCDRDVLISAATAAGKTEAAFLPIYSLLASRSALGIGALYVSPLKALINDQMRRQESLSDITKVPVTPWHSDASLAGKKRLRRDPGGVLLITPESLESLLMNSADWCSNAFKHLSHVVIDEFHALLGSERGIQLQSLLRRLEFLIGRQVPRIALSATLGDMAQVARSLRLNQEYPCETLIAEGTHADLRLQLRGYTDPIDENKPSAMANITNDLYRLLRGHSHLIFANSRARTEAIAADLSDMCNMNHVPNEFFPHHGSLSKELREDLEARLQKEQLPTSAVCTMTLELGIDIGHVDSVAQVTSPHSVASLRQRLGRSGRRDEAAVLRLFIPESELTKNSHIVDRLRVHLIQSIAMVNLLLNKWYEPPGTDRYHFSTLVQQTLSTLAQYGGVRAQQLWQLLCSTGPFYLVDSAQYAELLRGLGEADMITQTQDGQIVLGKTGEQYVEHYTFYAAFNTPEEYVLEADGKVLGSLPIDKPLMIGQTIIFGGKRWQVRHINDERKRILLTSSPSGSPPSFGGEGMSIHRIIREEMFRVYTQSEFPGYLDSEAKSLLQEAFDTFKELSINKHSIIQLGNTTHLLTWLGDTEINTLVHLLRQSGLDADSYGGVIDVERRSKEDVLSAFQSIISNPPPSAESLVSEVPDILTLIEKHDALVPESLRQQDYAKRMFDIPSTLLWIKKLLH